MQYRSAEWDSLTPRKGCSRRERGRGGRGIGEGDRGGREGGVINQPYMTNLDIVMRL